MRRILLTVTGTLSGLGVLLLYPTSTNHDVAGSTSASVGVSAGSVAAGSTSPGSASPGNASSGNASSGNGTAAGAPSGPAAGAAPAAPAPAPASGTYSASTQMHYGTVTVTITVTDGRITDASGTEDAPDGRSQSIARQAMPTLNTEAVDAQSASIAIVSHATYTSEAYAQSLQAALDQVGGS